MTEAKLFPISTARKLFQSVPDTDMSRLIGVAFALTKSHPDLIDRVERDLDARAIAKKKDRMRDQAWNQSPQPIRGSGHY